MAWNDTEIANRALGILGFKGVVVDLQNDTTPQAKVLRSNYALALADLMSEAPFGAGVRQGELSPVGDPSVRYSPDWHYAFRYPPLAAMLNGLLDSEGGSGRRQTELSEIPYRILSDDDGRLILTDLENAWAEWIQVPDESALEAKLVQALAMKLAMMSAPVLGREGQAGQDLAAPYARLLSDVKAAAANKDQVDRPADPPHLRARRGPRYPEGPCPWGHL